MHKKTKWFTLIELNIVIIIVWIIIIWISISISKISKNIQDSKLNTNIFEDVREFWLDSSFLSYSSWITYSWWVLLYNNNNWVLIWSFLDNNLWYNYEFNFNKEVYNKNYFWMFYLDTKALTWVLNNTWSVFNLNFNKGKIYKKLLIKDIGIISYNTWSLYEINLEIFKRYKTNYFWENKIDLVIPKDDYLKFNLNF